MASDTKFRIEEVEILDYKNDLVRAFAVKEYVSDQWYDGWLLLCRMRKLDTAKWYIIKVLGGKEENITIKMMEE